MSNEKHPPYAVMIQEVLSSKRRSFSRRFISKYILSNYPCLIHDDDHTTLLNQTLQELTRRKIISVTMYVEHQSEERYTLKERAYNPKTCVERATTALHLRPAYNPRVAAQHPQGEGENRACKTIYRLMRKQESLKIRAIEDIARRIDVAREVVQDVMKNVLQAWVAVVAKIVVAQVVGGVEQQIIVEEVKERIKRMLVQLSESIVKIAEEEDEAAAAATKAAPAPAAAETSRSRSTSSSGESDNDEVDPDYIGDYQNYDD